MVVKAVIDFFSCSLVSEAMPMDIFSCIWYAMAVYKAKYRSVRFLCFRCVVFHPTNGVRGHMYVYCLQLFVSLVFNNVISGGGQQTKRKRNAMFFFSPVLDIL